MPTDATPPAPAARAPSTSSLVTDLQSVLDAIKAIIAALSPLPGDPLMGRAQPIPHPVITLVVAPPRGGASTVAVGVLERLRVRGLRAGFAGDLDGTLGPAATEAQRERRWKQLVSQLRKAGHEAIVITANRRCPWARPDYLVTVRMSRSTRQQAREPRSTRASISATAEPAGR